MYNKQALSIIGKILVFLSLFMGTSLFWMFHFQEMSLLRPLLIAIFLTLFVGFLFISFSRGFQKELHIKEGYMVVSLSWIMMGVFGALPYYLTGAIPSFIDAIFESVSGFTTTGSSVLIDVEAMPHTLLYWRSLTHWIGGIGIIVLVIAILPALKITGYHLLYLEVSGRDPEKIIPRTSEIAKTLWLIYITLTVILIGLLMLGGVSFFDSMCHAFGTVATGGFSTKNASIGYFSPYVQYTIMVFMLLAGINFSLYFFLLRGRFGKIKRNSELKAYLLITFIAGLLIGFDLFLSQDATIEHAIRDAFFQVISILTATGFATADYMQWETSAWIIILSLMFVGACVGSTGGGIKVMRHVVAIKNIQRYFTKQLHPNLVTPVRVNGIPLSEEKVSATVTFIFLYLTIVVISSLFMAMLGLDPYSALGSVLATLGGIGPGIGEVGPAGNFSHIPDIGKVYLSFLMILGRLEIMTVLILFTPSFWKK